jgi:hypothetical protein
MKKTLLLLLAPVLIGFHAHAQTNGLLSLSLGPGLPIGEFASKDVNDPTSGLAKLGALADLSYQHLFSNSHFGWMGTLRYRFNGVDKNATIAPFEAQYPAFNWSMNSCRWSSAAALVGAYYQFSLTPKLSLSASVEAGAAECWSPKESITGIDDSANLTRSLIEVTLHSVSATAFTALGGVGACYRCTDKWSVMARLNYSYLKPTFKNMTVTVVQATGFPISGLISLTQAQEASVSTTSRNYTQPMSTLDLTIGVCREL